MLVISDGSLHADAHSDDRDDRGDDPRSFMVRFDLRRRRPLQGVNLRGTSSGAVWLR